MLLVLIIRVFFPLASLMCLHLRYSSCMSSHLLWDLNSNTVPCSVLCQCLCLESPGDLIHSFCLEFNVSIEGGMLISSPNQSRSPNPNSNVLSWCHLWKTAQVTLHATQLLVYPTLISTDTMNDLLGSKSLSYLESQIPPVVILRTQGSACGGPDS